jgi:hypothetical protein
MSVIASLFCDAISLLPAHHQKPSGIAPTSIAFISFVQNQELIKFIAQNYPFDSADYCQVKHEIS